MKKKLILALCVFTSLVSCQKDNITEPNELVDNLITFTVDNSSTRVVGSNFEDGDIISVFAYNTDGSLFDWAYYAYDGSEKVFEPSGSALGYSELTQELKFIASYPATSSDEYTFSVSTDQSSEGNFEESDLLVAETSAVGQTKIELVFEHVLSNLVLNVSGGSYSDVRVNAKLGVACDLVAGSYDVSGEVVEFTPAQNSSTGVKAIVAPQTLTSGQDFISATVDGEEITAVMSTNLTLVSGSQYVIEWDLTEGLVTFDGKTIAKSGTVVSEPVNTKYGNLPVLPAERTDKAGDYYYAYHEADGKFNFAACYSDKYTCPVWVAGAMHSWYTGDSGRTDAYADDPDIPCYQVETLGSPYNKGHMIASSDRTRSTAMNKQAFYLSNIAPQLISYFNSGGGIWNNYEDYIKDQYESRNDTLFIVNGCHWANTNTVVKGTTVPTHYYKACLRLKKANSTTVVKTASRDELECVAFYFEHKSSQSKPNSSHMITIDKLEELTGENFFANVKNAPEDTFNASDWDL